MRVAEEKAKTLVNQEEIVRQAQAKANDIMAQAQVKFRDMRKASNDYVEDLMRHTDESMTTALAELRKTRQSLKSAADRTADERAVKYLEIIGTAGSPARRANRGSLYFNKLYAF